MNIYMHSTGFRVVDTPTIKNTFSHSANVVVIIFVKVTEPIVRVFCCYCLQLQKIYILSFCEPLFIFIVEKSVLVFIIIHIVCTFVRLFSLVLYSFVWFFCSLFFSQENIKKGIYCNSEVHRKLVPLKYNIFLFVPISCTYVPPAKYNIYFFIVELQNR